MSKTVSRAESTAPHVPKPDSSATTGITLHRLVRCARLTPAQAAVVAVDAWHAASELRPATSNGTDPQHAVRIDEHGTATLTAAVAPAEVVAALRRATGRPTTTDRDDRLRAALAEVIATPDRDAFERLAEAVAPVEPSVRRELAALVVAWTGAGPVTTAPRLVQPDGVAHEPAPWIPGAQRSRLTRPIWHRLWRPLAGLVVFALVVGVELTSLRPQLERDLARLGGVPSVRFGHPSVAPTSSAPTVGPSANGAVLGVTVRATRPCRPGASCPLTISVRLRPQPRPTTVRWSFRVLDPCRGSAPVTRHGGSVRLHKGDAQVVAVSTVRLPRARALDVYAVTRRPATAASAALHVPATRTGAPRC